MTFSGVPPENVIAVFLHSAVADGRSPLAHEVTPPPIPSHRRPSATAESACGIVGAHQRGADGRLRTNVRRGRALRMSMLRCFFLTIHLRHHATGCAPRLRRTGLDGPTTFNPNPNTHPNLGSTGWAQRSPSACRPTGEGGRTCLPQAEDVRQGRRTNVPRAHPNGSRG